LYLVNKFTKLIDRRFEMTQLDRHAPVLTIGVVAAELGVSPQAIRLYESEGMVLPVKTDTGRRMFSMHDVERLKCVRRMINEQGMNMAGIKRVMALIPCWDYRGGFDEVCRECRVYSEMVGPCWAARDVGEKCRGVDCRECDVYRMEMSCDEFKQIVHRRGRFAP
jgi:MerR family transcriptional regulator/heat shock protein HspR